MILVVTVSNINKGEYRSGSKNCFNIRGSDIRSIVMLGTNDTVSSDVHIATASEGEEDRTRE
jgi:hypothetical protein